METIDRSPSQNPDEFKSSFQILTLTWHYYLVITKQKIRNNGILLQQLKELNFKLPQLFTGSNNE